MAALFRHRFANFDSLSEAVAWADPGRHRRTNAQTETQVKERAS